ncbi:MAG: glycosyltransferase, partial [Bacillota bacterium]
MTTADTVHSPSSAPGVDQPARPVVCPRTVMQITWSLVAGGSETYALTLAANLDPRRYRVAFCAVDQGGALEPEIARLGIPCSIMHRRPGIDLRLMWRLYRLFKQTRVDVIHTHHFNQLFYSLLGAKLVGARIIHTEHSIECYKKRRLRLALRLLSLFCHRITAIGSDGQRFLLENVGIPARKLQVVHAGVDLARFTETRAKARQALGFSEQDRIVTIVARLSPEKNHALLLAAFADVIRRVPNARLLIVGDGTHRDAVRNEIGRLNLAAHVQMLGVRRDVPRILAASDLLVLSSDRE